VTLESLPYAHEIVLAFTPNKQLIVKCGEICVNTSKRFVHNVMFVLC